MANIEQPFIDKKIFTNEWTISNERSETLKWVKELIKKETNEELNKLTSDNTIRSLWSEKWLEIKRWDSFNYINSLTASWNKIDIPFDWKLDFSAEFDADTIFPWDIFKIKLINGEKTLILIRKWKEITVSSDIKGYDKPLKSIPKDRKKEKQKDKSEEIKKPPLSQNKSTSIFKDKADEKSEENKKENNEPINLIANQESFSSGSELLILWNWEIWESIFYKWINPELLKNGFDYDLNKFTPEQKIEFIKSAKTYEIVSRKSLDIIALISWAVNVTSLRAIWSDEAEIKEFELEMDSINLKVNDFANLTKNGLIWLDSMWEKVSEILNELHKISEKYETWTDDSLEDSVFKNNESSGSYKDWTKNEKYSWILDNAFKSINQNWGNDNLKIYEDFNSVYLKTLNNLRWTIIQDWDSEYVSNQIIWWVFSELQNEKAEDWSIKAKLLSFIQNPSNFDKLFIGWALKSEYKEAFKDFPDLIDEISEKIKEVEKSLEGEKDSTLREQYRENKDEIDKEYSVNSEDEFISEIKKRNIIETSRICLANEYINEFSPSWDLTKIYSEIHWIWKWNYLSDGASSTALEIWFALATLPLWWIVAMWVLKWGILATRAVIWATRIEKASSAINTYRVWRTWTSVIWWGIEWWAMYAGAMWAMSLSQMNNLNFDEIWRIYSDNFKVEELISMMVWAWAAKSVINYLRNSERAFVLKMKLNSAPAQLVSESMTFALASAWFDYTFTDKEYTTGQMWTDFALDMIFGSIMHKFWGRIKSEKVNKSNKIKENQKTDLNEPTENKGKSESPKQEKSTEDKNYVNPWKIDDILKEWTDWTLYNNLENYDFSFSEWLKKWGFKTIDWKEITFTWKEDAHWHELYKVWNEELILWMIHPKISRAEEINILKAGLKDWDEVKLVKKDWNIDYVVIKDSEWNVFLDKIISTKEWLDWRLLNKEAEYAVIADSEWNASVKEIDSTKQEKPNSESKNKKESNKSNDENNSKQEKSSESKEESKTNVNKLEIKTETEIKNFLINKSKENPKINLGKIWKEVDEDIENLLSNWIKTIPWKVDWEFVRMENVVWKWKVYKVWNKEVTKKEAIASVSESYKIEKATIKALDIWNSWETNIYLNWERLIIVVKDWKISWVTNNKNKSLNIEDIDFSKMDKKDLEKTFKEANLSMNKRINDFLKRTNDKLVRWEKLDINESNQILALKALWVFDKVQNNKFSDAIWNQINKKWSDREWFLNKTFWWALIDVPVSVAKGLYKYSWSESLWNKIHESWKILKNPNPSILDKTKWISNEFIKPAISLKWLWTDITLTWAYLALDNYIENWDVRDFWDNENNLADIWMSTASYFAVMRLLWPAPLLLESIFSWNNEETEK